MDLITLTPDENWDDFKKDEEREVKIKTNLEDKIFQTIDLWTELHYSNEELEDIARIMTEHFDIKIKE